MSKIKIPKHLHLYKRIDLVPSYKVKAGKSMPYLVLACQHPTCSHRIPIKQAIGKMCECWRCGQPMILDKISIELARPHHHECVVKRSAKHETIDKLKELIEGI